MKQLVIQGGDLTLNNCKFDVHGSQLNIQGNLYQTLGPITNSSNNPINIVISGTYNSSGNITANNMNITIKKDYTISAGTVDLNGDLNLQSGTLNINDNFLNVTGNLFISGGTIDLAQGEIDVNGSLTQTGGTLNVDGGYLYVSGNYTLQNYSLKEF